MNPISDRGLLLFFVLTAALLLPACQNDDAYTPKPRGYPKVNYPEQREYRSFDEDYCNFTFQYPVYAEIQQDTDYFDEKPAHPCWFDIYFPHFDSRIYCSYYELGQQKSLAELKRDAFEMVDWHKKRANYIGERRVSRPQAEVYGFVFEIEGPAASNFQFYLTDSTDHFLRGALYFNAKARPDSIAPVFEFVREDALKMIETMEWGG